MDLPDVVQFFLKLPTDSELDDYLHKELRSEDWTSCRDHSDSSPHLTPSDNVMLDLEYWTNSPDCQLLKQHILAKSSPKPLVTQKEVTQDWIDDMFDDIAPLPPKILPLDDSITEPESDEPGLIAVAPLPSKALPGDDSITELESDEPELTAVIPLPSKTLPSDDSITEPESDDIAPLPSKTIPGNDSITEPESDEPEQHVVPSKILPSDGSITEPESEPNTPKPIVQKLDRKWFATPSPPPPDSIYWKYFTREEEARFYDRSRTDKSFQAVRELKQQLQLSIDKELRK